MGRGDKVAIVEPDYFDNRKLVEFFEGELVPVKLDYLSQDKNAGVNLAALEESFKQGVKLFLYSNPNNPTGVIFSEEETREIARLAKKYNVILLVDQLYSRQIFDNHPYTHLRALPERPENMLTIMGPSKTELSQWVPAGNCLRDQLDHRPDGKTPGHRHPAGTGIQPICVQALVQ